MLALDSAEFFQKIPASEHRILAGHFQCGVAIEANFQERPVAVSYTHLTLPTTLYV